MLHLHFYVPFDRMKFLNSDTILPPVDVLLPTCTRSGWGSIEYGPSTELAGTGQVEGGRWKPFHHILRSSTFADQLAACNQAGHCFVTNDVGVPFSATVSLRLLNVVSGESEVVQNVSVDLPAGAGVVEWFCGGGYTSTTNQGTYTYYPCQTPLESPEITVVTSPASTTLAECQSTCDNSSTCVGFLKHVQTDYYPFAKQPPGCSWFHQNRGNISAFRLANSEPTDWWQKPSIAAFPGPSAPTTCAVPKQKACTSWSLMSQWNNVKCDKAGSNCVAELVVTNRETASTVSTNVQLFVPPKLMQLPLHTVSVEVGAQSVPTNEVELTVCATGPGTSLYVVLTTLAEGRFSENAFLLEGGSMNQKRVSFLSWKPLGDEIVSLLKSSLRVEHLAEYVT
eukprot:COSAG02_NODE_10953_length_1825_cov_1.475666_2_plen_395_part_00